MIGKYKFQVFSFSNTLNKKEKWTLHNQPNATLRIPPNWIWRCKSTFNPPSLARRTFVLHSYLKIHKSGHFVVVGVGLLESNFQGHGFEGEEVLYSVGDLLSCYKDCVLIVPLWRTIVLRATIEVSNFVSNNLIFIVFYFFLSKYLCFNFLLLLIF